MEEGGGTVPDKMEAGERDEFVGDDAELVAMVAEVSPSLPPLPLSHLSRHGRIDGGAGRLGLATRHLGTEFFLGHTCNGLMSGSACVAVVV
jgi:hypothetical protein